MSRDVLVACAGYTFIAMIVVALAFFISTAAKTYDTEIWNGKVISKDRNHDTYEEAYQCNCRTVSTRNSDGTTSSNTQCDTCYRTHYTVEWTARTTVGQFQIDKLDETSRRVYNAPDPHRYTIIKPGDPAARKSQYINYVQAVPESLFAPASKELHQKFKGMIPDYPDKIYDHYKVDHFLSPGWNVADRALWNADIANALRDIGGRKQVNLIVVVAKTNDVGYEYALRDAWEGVNKNDVVLLIGSTEYPKIDFVRVISWTKNEAFKIELRDAVMDKGTIDRSIVDTCTAHIEKNYQRREMKDFEYLPVDPPDWLVFVLYVLLGAGAVGAYIFIQRKFK